MKKIKRAQLSLLQNVETGKFVMGKRKVKQGRVTYKSVIGHKKMAD